MELFFIILNMTVLVIGIIGIIINPEVTFWIFIVLITGLDLFIIINSLSLFFIGSFLIT